MKAERGTMLSSIDDPRVNSASAVPQHRPTPIDVGQGFLISPAPLHGKAVARICRPQKLVLDAVHLDTTHRPTAIQFLTKSIKSINQSCAYPSRPLLIRRLFSFCFHVVNILSHPMLY